LSSEYNDDFSGRFHVCCIVSLSSGVIKSPNNLNKKNNYAEQYAELNFKAFTVGLASSNCIGNIEKKQTSYYAAITTRS